MNLHKSKIEWCTHTWNPVTGCLHGCPYCYARRFVDRFKPHPCEHPGAEPLEVLPKGSGCYYLENPAQLYDETGAHVRPTPYPKGFSPTYHAYAMDYPSKRAIPSRVFVSSMGDLFGEWVPDIWIQDVFDACDKAPQHTYVWSNYNEYDGEAGFLTGFGPEMLAALLTTTLTVAKPTVDGGGSETFQDKVFLLSMAEVGLGSENGISEGSKLALFSDNNSRKAYPTAQAVSNSEYTNSSLSASQPWYWWLRSPASSNANSVRYVYSDGSLDSYYAYIGYWGVRPALNLSSDILVSDSPDSEGYYTIIWNNNPNTPPSITVPETVRSGKNLTVTWAASVDPDGDAVSYELERQYNGGGWSNVYSGSATTFTDTGITGSMNTVAYRVRAKDSKAAYSAYTTSPTRTVTHNVDPTISGTNQNLGTVTSPPSYQYSVGDSDTGDTLEIVESLDGVEVRTIQNAVRGQSYTFALTAAQFTALTGQHTMSIKVTDSAGNSATRTITFTRTISRIDFDWKVDDTSAAAEKILVSMRYNAHEDGVLLQVCNNYNDASPTWETATVGLKHIFSNKTKTADSWAVGVRVTIDKTSGWDTISCYSLSASYI